MNQQLTLGSLFSGSGGFELAGKLCGIKPVWASEIEPFPIRVTTKRLPEVMHLGDICKLNGAKIPPVDIITFGSPCTNLSVANAKREGLAGKQSGLFYEAIRIIKEMRKESNGTYPRYIAWENVPGAFNSNGCEDFRNVLTEIVQIIEPGAEVPACPKGGWPYADVLVGDGWSVAYRTIDAQYFGVAQRRRRIYLVADFMSERAGDILFERQGLCRDLTPVGSTGQEAAGYPAEGADLAVAFEPGVLNRLGRGIHNDLSPTLRASVSDNNPAAIAVENHPTDSRVKLSEDGTVQTLASRMGTGGNNTPLALCMAGNIIGRSDKNGGNGLGVKAEIAYTLSTADRHAVAFTQNQRNEVRDLKGRAGALSANAGMKQQTYVMNPGCFAQVCAGRCPCLQARDWKDPPFVNEEYVVRRLIPKECALLQGFSPNWCAGLETPEPTEEDISFWTKVFEEHRLIVGKSKKPKSRNQIIKWLRKPHSDGAEYKMWGNGICLQCACFVLGGITEIAREG